MVMALIYTYTDISKISIIIFHDLLTKREEQHKGNTSYNTWMRDFKVSSTMWEFKVVWHTFIEIP